MTTYYRGVNDEEYDFFKKNGYLASHKLPHHNMYGLYVSKTQKLSKKYGKHILKLNLKGIKVFPSGHSNQYVVFGPIAGNRVTEL